MSFRLRTLFRLSCSRPQLPLLALFVVFFGSTLGATLVVPPTFNELVDRADLVFEGTVVDVRSEWRATRGGRQIMSQVTYRLGRGLKGGAPLQVVLEVFGGTVGRDTMRIGGMPDFSVGDHDLLFVRQGGAEGLPLVGLMHGRFRVSRAPDGREWVTTYDGRAIASLASIGAPPRALAANVAGVAGLTLDEFVSGIAERVASGAGASGPKGVRR